MSKFRVAVSADFLRPDGSPSFADFDLTPLKADPRIEIGYVAAENDILPATALQDYDALILFGNQMRRARSSLSDVTRLAGAACGRDEHGFARRPTAARLAPAEDGGRSRR